jgi:hypothetical protein
MKAKSEDDDDDDDDFCPPAVKSVAQGPKKLNKQKALEWARKALIRNRGKELVGNFNPLLIGELLWEQSEKWEKMAATHVDNVASVASRFLKTVLHDKCPEDVESKIWTLRIQDELKARKHAAFKELGKLMQDHRNYPINYNHYYTDTINKRRQERQKDALTRSLESATTTNTVSPNNGFTSETTTKVDIAKVVASYSQSIDPNMDKFSCEEAIDCLFAIYKVSTTPSLSS